MPGAWTEEELKRDISRLRERIAHCRPYHGNPRQRHALSYLRAMLREREETLALVRYRSTSG